MKLASASASASASAADVSGEWLFKGSAFGSRLPLPPASSGSFLDVGALKSLLPSRSGQPSGRRIPSLLSRAAAGTPLLDGDEFDSTWGGGGGYERQRPQSAQEPSASSPQRAPPPPLAPEDAEGAAERSALASEMGMSIAEMDAIDRALDGEHHRMEEYKLAFARHDADGSGVLDRDELRAVIEELHMDLGSGMDEREVSELVDEADVDGDGHIDYAEFVTLMEARERIAMLASTITAEHAHDNNLRAAGGASLGGGGRSASMPELPPLKIAELQSKRHLRQFDQYYSRPTPHCLRAGNQARSRELRQELTVSEHAVEKLHHKVLADVEWVRANCAVNSIRAQIYCQRWGVEKLNHVLKQIAMNIEKSALHKWVAFAAYKRNEEKAEYYLKCRGSRKLTTMLRSWKRKRFLSAWNSWMMDLARQRRAEQEAGSCEVQRIVRGMLARILVRRIYEGEAAEQIQRVVRGFVGRRRAVGRRELKLRHDSARSIQRKYRSHVCKRLGAQMLDALRQHRSAVFIQRRYRGLAARRLATLLAEHVHEQHCAVQIQKLVRAKEARAEALKRREAKKEDRGALMIQTRFRAHQGRECIKHIREEMHAAIAIQTRFRSHQSAQAVEDKRRLRAVLKIQCCWRGQKGRFATHLKLQAEQHTEIEQRESAISIQCMFRMFAGRRALRKARADRIARLKAEALAKKRHDAARRIQTWFRGKEARHHFVEDMEARRVLAELKRRSATTIQCRMRVCLAKKRMAAQRVKELAHVKEMEQKATLIQASIRKQQAEKAMKLKLEAHKDQVAKALELMHHHKLEDAAIKLQCLYRGKRAHKASADKREEHAKAMREAEDAEARHAQELAEHDAAVHMQAVARGRAAKAQVEELKEVHERELAGLSTEAEIVARKAAQQKKIAAIVIQHAARGYIAHKIMGRMKAQKAVQQGAEREKMLADAAAHKEEADTLKAKAELEAQLAQQKKEATQREREEELERQKAMSHEELAKELERQEKEAEEQAEREVAALKMQNAARVKAAKAEVEERRAKQEEEARLKEEQVAKAAAALTLQCFVRQRLARNAQRRKLEEKAARIEQMRLEEIAEQELADAQEEQERELAAMRIQSLVRGHLARLDVTRLRRETKEKGQMDANLKQEWAALKLQAITRGQLSRKKVSHVREDLTEKAVAKDKQHEKALVQAGGGHTEDEWVEHWDDGAQAFYYFNTRTEEASWTKPGQDGGGYGTDGNATDYDTDNAEYAGANDEWVQYWDDSSQAFYYYNSSSGECSWTRPGEEAGTDDYYGYDSAYDSDAGGNEQSDQWGGDQSWGGDQWGGDGGGGGDDGAWQE